MNGDQEVPHLWITYAWTQREEADFSYLVSQLKEAGIQATYDAVEILPELHLDEWAERRTASLEIDGWAYILTSMSTTRRHCADELIGALERIIQRRGTDFPLIGLLHGVAMQSLPPALKVRPCYYLTDSGWKQQVAAALKNRAKRESTREETRFLWAVHPCYGGDPEMTAIEVGPRMESIPYWRFAVPKSAPMIKWGQGSRGGGEISPIKFSVVRGSGRMGNYDVNWFGAANAVSVTESAYAVFAGRLPEFVCFGPAKGPQGPPDKMEMFRTNSHHGGTERTQGSKSATAICA
jgi:hypothetical protein